MFWPHTLFVVVLIVLYGARFLLDKAGLQPDSPNGKIALCIMIFLMVCALTAGLYVDSGREFTGLLSAGLAIALYLLVRKATYGDSDG